MATDPFDALRLTLMQDLLPVGLAVVDRARKGGPQAVLAAFDGRSEDPLGSLRQEGECLLRFFKKLKMKRNLKFFDFYFV